jgi:hypothetical protein
MCVDCVLASPRIAHVDPGDEPLPEVVLSHHLHDVFNALRVAHLFGNLDKCTFCTDRVSFLGYVVTPQGIEVDHG